MKWQGGELAGGELAGGEIVGGQLAGGEIAGGQLGGTAEIPRNSSQIIQIEKYYVKIRPNFVQIIKKILKVSRLS